MKDDIFHKTVENIIEKDPRYKSEVYEFIKNAVNYTAVKLGRHKNKKDERHIKGNELLTSIVEYAIEQFGPLAADVMQNWGVRSGMDVGNIVFNMVNNGLLSASREDSIEDFKTDFDFLSALKEPFSKSSLKNINPPIIV